VLDYAVDFSEVCAIAAQECERNPLDDQVWVNWQAEFMRDMHACRLIRGANQIGKTLCLVADMLHEIRGTSPYRPRRFTGPINVILIGESIEQMSTEGSILEKLWEMIPKDEIDPRVSFVRGYGLRGVRQPAIRFVAGPGAGSVIRIRTYKQDPSTLAGSTIHAIYCDEPTPGRTYGELVPRIFAHGGSMTIGFTPTLNMPDMVWLKDLVEARVFAEHHVVLTPEATWCEGFARPRKTQAEIDEYRERLPAVERSMRIEAAWEPVFEGRYFTAFTDACVKPFALSEIAGAWLTVGTDHGLKAGKQASVLTAVIGRHTDEPRAYVIAEAQSDGYTTPAQDARAIVAMLASVGLSWKDVDEWVGDRQTGDGNFLKSKNNTDLRRHLAAACGVTMEDFPFIHLPKKWNGSLTHGMRLLNGMAAAGNFVVHPRCPLVIKACMVWKGEKMDPVKDVLDATRYPIERSVMFGRSDGIKVRILT